MLAEKKLVVEIDEKYVDQKNHHAMATYIIGKAYDKKKTLHSFDETKKWQTFIAPKK